MSLQYGDQSSVPPLFAYVNTIHYKLMTVVVQEKYYKFVFFTLNVFLYFSNKSIFGDRLGLFNLHYIFVVSTKHK
jgi:hypothetical protein